MHAALVHAWFKSFPFYWRALVSGALYLACTLSVLSLVQIFLRGIWPKTWIIGLGLLGNSLIFYAPIVMGFSMLWAIAWLAYHWRIHQTPLFFELNAIPKSRLLWVIQPFLLPISVLICLLLHHGSPIAGQRLHAQAQHQLGEQIPVGQIEQWGDFSMGARQQNGQELSSVFIADRQFYSLSDRARIGEQGQIHLMEGEFYRLDPRADWSLQFQKATLVRHQDGLNWSVHMLESQRLRQKISETSNAAALERELFKRTTQSVVLWLLGMSVLILGLIGLPIGLNMGGALLSWWLSMRFFDHQLQQLGPLGSALGPVLTQVLVFVAVFTYWQRK